MGRANKVAVASGAELPDRIVQLMTNARYASFVVRCDSDRTVFLPEIISLHTRRELAEIDGIGRASIARIQTWLAQQGRRLRRPGESIDSVALDREAGNQFCGCPVLAVDAWQASVDCK